MNNEELIAKYKETLDILKFGIDDSNVYEAVILYENKVKLLRYSTDIIEKSFSFIDKFFNIEAQPYVKFILVYRNGNWFKYNSTNPYPIQLHLGILLTNNELFKIIKRALYNQEKNNLITFFLKMEINSSHLEDLHLWTFKTPILAN